MILKEGRFERKLRSNVWDELFQDAEVPFISPPIYCMPLDQTWRALANLTLLGGRTCHATLRRRGGEYSHAGAKLAAGNRTDRREIRER
jgi:hypothetical protein